MSNNPFSEMGVPQPGPVGGGQAAEMVKLPAILLLVAGGIGVLTHLIQFVANIMGMGAVAAAADDAQRGFAIAQGVGGVLGIVIGLACDGVVLFGAWKMKQLQSYGLSMAASIVAMLPCISCGCLVGLPVGIWALIVINKPEVKSAFR